MRPKYLEVLDEIKSLFQRIRELEEQRDLLLAALKAVEWVKIGDWYVCPWCKTSIDGSVTINTTPKPEWSELHRIDCQRQAAIAAVKGER